MALTSCDHKELCLDHRTEQRVKVEFDWADVPDATPGGMAVFFYPVDDAGVESGTYIRVDFKGKDGGYVDLPRGTYRMITYSNDSEINQAHTIADFHGHTIFTREGSVLEGLTGGSGPRADGQESQRVVITPDRLLGCSHTEVDIIETSAGHSHTQGAGRSSDITIDTETGVCRQVITLRPQDMTCLYTYEIRNVANLKHATKFCAAISGMCPSITAAYGDKHTEPVTLPLEAHSDGNSLITGAFYTFGHHTDNTAPHIMTLYVWMDDGRKFVYGTGAKPGPFDVTAQVENAPNPRRVHLVIDGVALPEPDETGSGFPPSVDGWGTVESDIIM